MVIVTGSTKGIGRAMVEGLARAGASVVVSSRKQDLCDEVAAEVAATTGAEVLGLACHVGEWDTVPGVRRRCPRTLRSHRRAREQRRDQPRDASARRDMTLDYWRKVFSVNLEGPLRTSQCVLPTMREQGGGSIVNIGTMAAYSGRRATSARTARRRPRSLNLTKSMAMDWAPWNVRVNMLSPGPFMSEMMEGGAKTAARASSTSSPAARS